MYYVFYSTNDVFEAESILQRNSLKHEIVPTPIIESIYCGVCIRTKENKEVISNLLKEVKWEVYDEIG